MRLVLLAGLLSTCGPPPRARPPLEQVPIGIESSRSLPPPGSPAETSGGSDSTPRVVPDEGVPDLSDVASGSPGVEDNPLQQLMPEGGAAAIGDILP